MQLLLIRGFLCWLLLSFALFLPAQEQASLRFFQPADSLHKARFWTATSIGAGVYSATMIGLNELWYADFERSAFHFFNDAGEWNDMDKAGHLFTAYFESRWVFQGARWTGINRSKAAWIGAAAGTVLQASIETLDGFSEKWGFSIPDIAFNTLGVTMFIGQEMLWQEQRITFKVSSTPTTYPRWVLRSLDGGHTDLLKRRADELFGSHYTASFLKDYNAMTIWASANLKAFAPQSRLPDWLNVAVGYGAHNLYGGFDNKWEWQGHDYRLSEQSHPRYRQFYLSPDIDLTRIKTNSPFLKTLFSLFNVLKIPAPALEINTLGKFKFHALYF